jgi:pyrroline-5-carboxylate reductase
MNKDFSISFIGAGNMGEAMIKGLLSAGVSPKRILAWDVAKKRLNLVCSSYKVKKARGLKDALGADVAVVAVKPQVIDDVLAAIAGSGVKPGLIITIAAGVPIKRFTAALGGKARVARVMPNTPALIGQGVSAYFVGGSCTKKDQAAADTVISALGPCFRVSDESLMDAVTGLSGSGPAYVFVFIEALADAGVKMGLPRALARDLAMYTVAGAARMVIETGENPAQLKDKVASPGGTTIGAAVIDAVEAATLRSKEMGEGMK